MHTYMNHHGTQMNVCITRIHMNECVMSQIQSLFESMCVCIYIINRIMYILSLHTYHISLHTYTYVWVKYDLIHEKT